MHGCQSPPSASEILLNRPELVYGVRLDYCVLICNKYQLSSLTPVLF